MRSIQDIYSRYSIPPNLVRHQLEVTAVGRYICDHWTGDSVDKGLVTEALLLHDMGNIIKFKRPFLGELEKDAAHWEQVQADFIRKYGSNVHVATNAIVADITTNQLLRDLVNALDVVYLSVHGYPDMNARVCNYADMCVSPMGIVGFEARLLDLLERYGLGDSDEHLIRRRTNASMVERLVDIDLSWISETDFSGEIEKLRGYILGNR